MQPLHFSTCCFIQRRRYDVGNSFLMDFYFIICWYLDLILLLSSMEVLYQSWGDTSKNRLQTYPPSFWGRAVNNHIKRGLAKSLQQFLIGPPRKLTKYENTRLNLILATRKHQSRFFSLLICGGHELLRLYRSVFRISVWIFPWICGKGDYPDKSSNSNRNSRPFPHPFLSYYYFYWPQPEPDIWKNLFGKFIGKDSRQAIRMDIPNRSLDGWEEPNSLFARKTLDRGYSPVGANTWRLERT